MALVPTNFIGPVNTGVKATSPTATLTAPKTTLSPAQTAPNDLSGTYANVGGTIYNKQSQTAFPDQQSFFKDSGLTSFNNVKFDTAYTPTGRETVYGQAKPLPATPPATSTPTPSTPPAPTGPYTPPNQGTTGVSQGGIVGNLLGIAQKETPEVTKARADLKALNEDYAKQTSNIEGSPIDLSLATGQEGILNRLFAAKQGAAQAALQSALESQGQQIGATTNAGNLNAPIVTTPGAAVISPTSNLTVGGTTSGASNLSSLIGTRPSSVNPKVTAFYNTQTNQDFPNPQALADFVNQQIPGVGATKDNVFTLLDQIKAGGGVNIVGGNSGLNPISQVNTIAQQVLSGQLSPAVAQSMGGTIANWSTLLNQALISANGGSAPDISALQAKYDANQNVQNQQAILTANYQSAKKQATNLGQQFTDLIKQYNLNPSGINVVNGVMQAIGANTSDWRYQALANYANDIVNTYTQILSAGGVPTDLVRSISGNFLNQLASGASIQASLDTLDQQAQAKIAGVKTPSTTGTNTNSGNSSTLGLF